MHSDKNRDDPNADEKQERQARRCYSILKEGKPLYNGLVRRHGISMITCCKHSPAAGVPSGAV
ncbi:hypothetical protein FRB91_003962 [Serendipita sp. 411]|nr:hypothetical protein FRB91_003962 [Serendipita sp. 411]